MGLETAPRPGSKIPLAGIKLFLTRWWSHLPREADKHANQSVRLSLPGWKEEAQRSGLREWRDPDGDLLSLAEGAIDYPFAAVEVEQQRWCREFAQSCGGGLIEVRSFGCGIGQADCFVYKQLQLPAYIYIGMLIIRAQAKILTWTVLAGERGVTGMREAAVTASLLNEGKLTFTSYRDSWAKDPYEPTYRGVDQSVRRFMSDDEGYDQQFPQHPLSKVRRVIAELPRSVKLEAI